MMDIQMAMAQNSYPGRGIVLGQSGDGRHAVVAYFIMGRSENSRNRVFVADGDGLRTQAHDPSKVTDPSLIIYAPVRTIGRHTIVTNGDQTDTIRNHLAEGLPFEAALRTRTFEPDAPNLTPRVSGLLTLGEGGFSYKMSILKSNHANPAATLRFFYEYDMPAAGQGHFLHTYAMDGDPLPSFAGEPKEVALSGGLDCLTDTIWGSLHEDNRVSLFVRFIDIETGKTDTRIVNKLALAPNTSKDF